MTLEQLTAQVRARRDRHRPARAARHAGAAPGQAPDRTPLPRRGRAPRRRGLQLPARGRRRHEHGRGLRDVLVGQGLRRLRDAARHLARCVRCRGRRGRRCASRTSTGRTAATSRRRRARCCARSSRGWPSAAGARTPAPSSSSWCSATATRTRGTRATATSSRPTSTTSTTRCSAPRGSSR